MLGLMFGLTYPQVLPLALLSVLAVCSSAAESVFELTPDNAGEWLNHPPKHYVARVHDDGEASRRSEYDFILTSAMYPEESAIAFAKLDAAAHPSIAVSLGVKSDVPKPAYVLIHKGKLKRVPLDSSGDAASLAALIEENTGIEARTSEVVSLTPSNFDQVAFNPKLSVMVEFYAPWCFHCKSLVPAYEELSRVFSRDRSVVIAKVDAAQHRSLAERNNVKGFPTLLWFPASPRRQRAVYEGGRTVEAMVRFVNQHAGTHRAVDGGVSDAAGRVPAFDAHVQECVVPGVKARQQREQEFKAVAKLAEKERAGSGALSAIKDVRSAAGLYRDVMRRVLQREAAAGRALSQEEAEAVVAEEKERLAAQLERTDADKPAFVLLRRRQNVLRAFLADPLDLTRSAELDAGSFVAHVNGRRPALVMFHAPWCPHCQRLSPVIDRVAGSVGGRDGLLVAKVDTTDNKELSRMYGIKGLPTLLWFGRGEDTAAPTKYEGARTQEAIEAFLKSQLLGAGARDKEEL